MTKDDQQPQQRHMAEMSAVDLAGQAAAFVSFQRHYGSHPPTQNANSAPRSLNPARQFSGNHAIFALITTTTATFTTFGYLLKDKTNHRKYRFYQSVCQRIGRQSSPM